MVLQAANAVTVVALAKYTVRRTRKRRQGLGECARLIVRNLARLGVTKDIRARILNHVEGAKSVTDAAYNQHEFWAEKRAALLAWEAELRRILGMADAVPAK